MSKGTEIKRLRESYGYSQTEFAKMLHVSKQLLYKYENGIVTNIPSDKIELIAKLFHVSPAYIMGWEDATVPAPSSDPLHNKISRLDDEDRGRAESYIDWLLSADKYQKNTSAGTA